MLAYKSVEVKLGYWKIYWRECVNDDMIVLGVQLEWTIFRDMWKDFILRKILSMEEMDYSKIIDDDVGPQSQCYNIVQGPNSQKLMINLSKT